MSESTNTESLEKSVIAEKRRFVPAKKRIVLGSGHVLKKRSPHVTRKGKYDFYVSRKTNFQAQLKKCEKLLDEGAPEIFIHGLGAAISTSCHLALQLKENHKTTLEIDVSTSTVDLVDDFVPNNEDEDFEINDRKNSVIHIRVFKTALTGNLQFNRLSESHLPKQ